MGMLEIPVGVLAVLWRYRLLPDVFVGNYAI
jgi:hypothetical protein